MRCNSFIKSFFSDILHDEDGVESREDRTLEVDLLCSSLEVVVTTEDWVSSSKDRGPGVEDGGDSSLSDGDGLLLHCLVNGYTILWSHLVELINTNDSSVCEYHCSSFELELSTLGILDDRGSQTSG